MTTALQEFTKEELDSQTAIELPDREMLSLVVIRNVANGTRIRINVSNNQVAVQVCALVQAIDALVAARLTCTISN
jgi:hypothetical protein